MPRWFIAVIALLMLAAQNPAAAPGNDTRILVKGLFRDTAIILIDGKQQILKKGQQGPRGIRLLEANSREARIEIDGEVRNFTLGDRIGGQFTTAADKARLEIWPDSSGTYYITGSINGLAVNFLVDTGATTIAMNEITARKLGLAYRLKGKEGRVTTASGIVRSWGVMLESVKIGEIEHRNIRAAVLQGEHPSIVLLGNSFLSRVHMERAGRKMIFSVK